MTVSELFRGTLTHFVFFFNFSPREGVNRNFPWSFSEWRVRYLKGQKWLMLKAATGIIDHGVRTKISVEQRAKALVFKKNRRSSLLEIARKVKSRSQL